MVQRSVLVLGEFCNTLRCEMREPYKRARQYGTASGRVQAVRVSALSVQTSGEVHA